MSDSKLEIMLSVIADLKNKVAVLEGQLKPIQGALDDAKSELMDYMVKTGSKRTEAVDGIFVVRAERITQQIVDPTAVKDWLEAEGFEIDEYMKLDEVRVKAVAEAALKETGEYLPGFATDSREYLTIRSAK